MVPEAGKHLSEKPILLVWNLVSSDLKNNKNGFMVKENDLNEMAEKILLLLQDKEKLAGNYKNV